MAAREVRKRLAQYCLEEGAHDPLRIDLPAGAYVPAFRGVPGNTETGLPAAAPARHRHVRSVLAILTVLLGAAAAVGGWRVVQHKPTDFEIFWQPALSQKTPIIVAMAHPLVYHPSTRASVLTEKKDGPQALPFQRPVDVAPKLLTGADFVPVFDQYAGFGDTLAAVRLAVLFSQWSRPTRVRLASKLDFNDLRDSATILVGAFTNRWTTELTRDFRYRFGFDAQRHPGIIDSTTGALRWLLDKADDGTSDEDYILICRVPHAQTGRFIIAGAGLTQHGTQEAGRILAEPDALMSILKQLPANWPQRNLEVVLHSLVIGDAPTSPELAAWHVW